MSPRVVRAAAAISDHFGERAVEQANAELLKAGTSGARDEIDHWAAVCAILVAVTQARPETANDLQTTFGEP